MSLLTLMPLTHNAFYVCRLTCDNIEKAERWCGGSIKGLKLPIEDRVIDIQAKDGEYRANIGDYIIQNKINGNFCVCNPYTFRTIFEFC